MADTQKAQAIADGELQTTRCPNHVDRRYQTLLRDILENGHESGDRTGTGTFKTFGRQLRFDLTEGFPLLTSKEVWFEGVARELLWFLRGETNIKPLVDEGVSIWTDNAYQHYLSSVEEEEYREEILSKEEFEEAIRECAHPDDLDDHYENFAGVWGELGEIYGKQWRRYGARDGTHVMGRIEPMSNEVTGGFDQIGNLIEQLKESPDSRRLRVSAWRPRIHMKGAPDEDEAVLPPCHVSFQVFTRELSLKERVHWAQRNGKELPTVGTIYEDHSLLEDYDIPRRALSLKWNQRSVDTFLGLPFNIASYALLAHLLADQVGMVSEELIFHGGDCHLYKNHVEQAEELLSRVPRADLPTLRIDREQPPEGIGDYRYEDLIIEDYDPHPKIEAPIAV